MDGGFGYNKERTRKGERLKKQCFDQFNREMVRCSASVGLFFIFYSQNCFICDKILDMERGFLHEEYAKTNEFYYGKCNFCYDLENW